MPTPIAQSVLDTILQSKLHQPRLYAGVLPRPQLIQRLDLETAYKVTLLSAPAGAGKTTLLSIWLEQHAHCVAWVSLDEMDSHLSSFATYVAAALGTEIDETPGELGSARYCAHYLLNVMEATPEIQLLVLDDYHEIADDSPVHQTMSVIIDNLPPHIHLVIASRSDPPLSLARLRSRCQLREVRLRDLCFSQSEVHAYLVQSIDQPIDESQAALLHGRSEGWPAVVRLAVLSLQQQNGTLAHLEALPSNCKFIMEDLADEILATVPDDMERFLLNVSILERCCAALCADITDAAEESCQEILQWLAAQNLFTTSIDAHNRWYRLHDLFREILQVRLRRRLGEQHMDALHGRASDWLARHGHVEAAVRHLRAIGKLEDAAGLVEAYKHELLNAERFRELEHLLRLLPAELIDQRPALLLTRALIYFFRGSNTSKIAETMQAFERCRVAEERQPGEEDPRALAGEAAALYSLLQYWRGNSERAIHSAREALALLPASHTYMRGLAVFYLGTAYQLMGNLPLAVDTLQRALVDSGANELSIQLRIRVALMLVFLKSGEWHQLVQVAHQLLKAAEPHHQPVSTGWAHWVLGLVHYEWNELDAAAQHFATVIGMQHRVRSDTLAFCYLGQGLVFMGQDQPQEADRLLDELAEMLVQNHCPELMLILDSFRARLALREGNSELAQSWVRSLDGLHLPTADVRWVATEVRVLTYIRILIAERTASSLRQASDLLAACLESASAVHNVQRLIEIKSLQSLVHAMQEETNAALDELREALSLAQRGNFMRTFVDLGPPMAALLQSLIHRDVLPESLCAYVQSILAAFSTVTHRRTVPVAESAAPSDLIEPLTERELEVLLLLGKRLSNKEIARELIISPRTVKKHTSNIYAKLQVSSRYQAVEQALSLAILPAEKVGGRT